MRIILPTDHRYKNKNRISAVIDSREGIIISIMTEKRVKDLEKIFFILPTNKGQVIALGLTIGSGCYQRVRIIKVWSESLLVKTLTTIILGIMRRGKNASILESKFRTSL